MQATNVDLLNSIQLALGAGIIPSLTTANAGYDLFEAYILCLILEAADAEGAVVSYRDVNGNIPSTFIFRTSPGRISTKTQNYCHAIIEFPNRPVLEAHLGVEVAGNSRVAHECDVCVLFQSEAENCRQNPNLLPRPSTLILTAECKFYTGSVGIDMARGFIGFDSDFPAPDCYFVVNTASQSAAQFLVNKNKLWDHEIVPSRIVDVARLRNAFQNTFKNFKAKKL